jgi:hypothetical protein
MADNEDDATAAAFESYIKMRFPPDDRPEKDSPRWRDLRSAFMAGARFGVEAMVEGCTDHG